MVPLIRHQYPLISLANKHIRNTAHSVIAAKVVMELSRAASSLFAFLGVGAFEIVSISKWHGGHALRERPEAVNSLYGHIRALWAPNYLLTSILCQFLFKWRPWKLYGRLDYYQDLYVVGCVWTLNIVISMLTLRYFRFGPMEWIWRSLTYWKRQSMRMERVFPSQCA
jgi:hypothetical protein